MISEARCSNNTIKAHKLWGKRPFPVFPKCHVILSSFQNRAKQHEPMRTRSNITYLNTKILAIPRNNSFIFWIFTVYLPLYVILFHNQAKYTNINIAFIRLESRTFFEVVTFISFCTHLPTNRKHRSYMFTTTVYVDVKQYSTSWHLLAE